MKVGRHYCIREVRRLDWDRCARELRLRLNDLNERIDTMLERLPELARAVAEVFASRGWRYKWACVSVEAVRE